MSQIYNIDGKDFELRELSSEEEKAQASALEVKVFAPNSKYKLKPKKECIYYGIFDNDKLVAMTRITLNPLKGWESDSDYNKLSELNPEIGICATAVDPEYRGKNLAKTLRAFLQNKYRSILTGTGPKSHPAMQTINQQQGFQKVLERGKKNQWFWKKEANFLRLFDLFYKFACK